MLGVVDYFKCSNCGFMVSKTHSEMDEKAWKALNYKFHSYIENQSNKKNFNQPPYLDIATLLNVLQKHEIISSNYIDWGGGYGTLSKIVLKYFNILLPVYEKYMQDDTLSDEIKYLSQDNIRNKKFETVVNSAVFEHITKKEHLDEINSFVSNTGSLVLHTVVCEEIPKDPDWFYLLAVHSAFHTNKSMSHLMKQWGYYSSIYCPTAKSWVLFKKKNLDIEEKIERINTEFQFEYLFYKKGFVDYWK
ncbi:hypothetical protein ACFL20_13610 [Spirochaetota bacterium]